jgi:hypothetical protein
MAVPDQGYLRSHGQWNVDICAFRGSWVNYPSRQSRPSPADVGHLLVGSLFPQPFLKLGDVVHPLGICAREFVGREGVPSFVHEHEPMNHARIALDEALGVIKPEANEFTVRDRLCSDWRYRNEQDKAPDLAVETDGAQVTKALPVRECPSRLTKALQHVLPSRAFRNERIEYFLCDIRLRIFNFL